MSTLVSALLVAAAMLLPLFIAGAIGHHYRRREEREGRRRPISDKFLHGPGEQLRQRIAKADEDIDANLVGTILIGPMFVAVWALQRVDWSAFQFHWLDGFFALVVIGALIGHIQRLVKRTRERRRMREGLIAERYVAQELDRLATQGCRTIHDIPADGFNLDHVVITPTAVWCVETKSVRKTEGPNGHRVTYDGKTLAYPTGRTSKSLEQAQRQARWLADYLRKATSLEIPVRPALALPGWYIQSTGNRAASDVRVFNPKGRGAEFMAEPSAQRFPDGWRALVANALEMRFPNEAKQP